MKIITLDEFMALPGRDAFKPRLSEPQDWVKRMEEIGK